MTSEVEAELDGAREDDGASEGVRERIEAGVSADATAAFLEGLVEGEVEAVEEREMRGGRWYICMNLSFVVSLSTY